MRWLGKQRLSCGIRLVVNACCCRRDGRWHLGCALSRQHCRILQGWSTGSGWPTSSLVSMQCIRSVLKPFQGDVSGLPKILFGELGTPCEVSVPVAVTPLFGFLACRIAAALAGEGKGGDLLQPGKPGGTLRGNLQYSSVTRLVEFVGRCHRRPGQRIDGDFRLRIPLVR